MKLCSGYDASCWKDVYLSCAFLNLLIFLVSLIYSHFILILITSFFLCLFIIFYTLLALETFVDIFLNKTSDEKKPSNEEDHPTHDIWNICVQRC